MFEIFGIALQVVLVPVALGLGLNTYAKTVVIFLRPVMSFVAMVPHCALVALLQSTEVRFYPRGSLIGSSDI